MAEHSINDLLKEISHSSLDCFEEYVFMIERNFNVNINIHDIVGISSFIPSLEKAITSHQYHNNCFCNYIKKNHRCLELCVFNKTKLCSKCSTTRTAFYDKCYMGIYELIYPVICDEKLIAIICIGQFYNDIDSSMNIILRNSSHYFFNKDEAESNFLKATKNLNFNLESFHSYIYMLIQHICLAFKLSLEYRASNTSDKGIHNEVLFVHKNNFILSTTTNFIRENYDKPLTLKLLAANSYCNPTYLSHLFKEKMNISITEYINNIRIQKAKELIDITSKSITEIGMMVGFNDLGYFGRVFKNIVGVSPKEYRKKA